MKIIVIKNRNKFPADIRISITDMSVYEFTSLCSCISLVCSCDISKDEIKEACKKLKYPDKWDIDFDGNPPTITLINISFSECCLLSCALIDYIDYIKTYFDQYLNEPEVECIVSIIEATELAIMEITEDINI